MPVFEYVGKNKYGQIVRGTKIAPTRDDAKRMVARDQIIVQKIKQKGGFGLDLHIFQGKVVKVDELSIFTRQLATIINAGIPIVQGLGILASQIKNKKFQSVVATVKSDIESGVSLEESLRKHPRAFSELYVNMASAGEKSGNMPEVLSRLAKYLEREASVRGKVKSAMTYPVVVLVVAISIALGILYKVVPTFAALFADLGAELPILTQILISASHLLVNNFIWLVLVTIGMFFAIRSYSRTYNGRRTIDRIKLKLPVFSDLLIKGAVARFSRTLSTMITSGIDLLVALEITAKTSGNSIIEDALMEARNKVTQGRSLNDSIEKFKVFPPMLSQMIKVGEETASLDEMLSKIADFYEEEVDRAVDTLLSLIEPIMIVFLGVLIGGMVVALYLPMFSLAQKI
jgi:type IV pilus assembly protein PilC